MMRMKMRIQKTPKVNLNEIFLSASLIERMTVLTPKNLVLGAVVAVLALYVVYHLDNTVFGLFGRRSEGFYDTSGSTSGAGSASAMDMMSQLQQAASAATGGTVPAPSAPTGPAKEGFADLASMEGPAAFASAEAPAGCYPRAQLTPVELLPADQDTIYAQQNPMGVGSLKGKNFLSAGALIGVNTVGQSLRNANLQLRSEPPNPQTPVSIFNQATIGPDISHRPLDVGA
jgi:hypothetical protein